MKVELKDIKQCQFCPFFKWSKDAKDNTHIKCYASDYLKNNDNIPEVSYLFNRNHKGSFEPYLEHLYSQCPLKNEVKE